MEEELGELFRPELKSTEYFRRQRRKEVSRRKLLKIGALATVGLGLAYLVDKLAFGEDQNVYQKEAKKALEEAKEEDLLIIKVQNKEGSPLRSSPVRPADNNNRVGRLKEGEIVQKALSWRGRNPQTGFETFSWYAFENPHKQGQIVFSYKENFTLEKE